MDTRRLLREAAEELRQTGVPEPEYDSGMLLSSVMGRPHLELRAGMGPEPTEEQAERFAGLMARRKNREPLQYLLGSVLFGSREILVGPGALIPRPETAELAAWAAERIRQRGGAGQQAPREAERIRLKGGAEPRAFGDADRIQRKDDAGQQVSRILDLCCGTGCIGISLQLDFPEAEVTLTDLSPEALEIARTNLDRYGLSCRVLRGDLFAPVAGEKFDLIVSNPPYIRSEECGSLQEEVRREPLTALDGGRDGLDFYRRIAREAPAHLNSGGLLMMEMGIGEDGEVRRLLEEGGGNGGAARTEIRKDAAGISRMILAEYD